MNDKQVEVIKSPKPSRLGWAWRYLPLILWMLFISLASTNTMSAGNTSRILRPLLLWLFPAMTETQLGYAHFFVRKGAHLTEYAIMATLAARAFLTSSKHYLCHHWQLAALSLVVIYALLDEAHQSFVPTRTGSIYDSLIDSCGGLAALAIMTFWRRIRKNKHNL